MGIKVDQWGNVWDEDDDERKFPVWPHPELTSRKAKCPECSHFVFRTRLKNGEFEWRCGCGKTFPGLHH
jgi:hypothetical protein